MVHGMFYSVLGIGFLVSIGIKWFFRSYFQLLILVHSIEILFMTVVCWYQFGLLTLMPLTALWVIGMGVIYMMNRFA